MSVELSDADAHELDKFKSFLCVVAQGERAGLKRNEAAVLLHADHYAQLENDAATTHPECKTEP